MDPEPRHVACISDFCGNYRSPGAWADLWQRPDGSQFITLGGGWTFYGPGTPAQIEQESPHFTPFLAAAAADEDFAYAAKHWPTEPTEPTETK